MASPPTANRRTKSRWASSRGSTTKSASSNEEHTGCAMKSTFGSKSSPVCCQCSDASPCFGLESAHTTSRRAIILDYCGTRCGGSAAMQIRSLMQPGAFGPEAIAAMGDALDAALKELENIGQSDVQSDVVRETIAGRIIGAARICERDPARLQAAALSGVTGSRIFRP